MELTPKTIFNIQHNYEEGGLEKALYDNPRPGQPIEFDNRIKSQIAAKVCSDPPESFDRLTLSSIQEKSVEEGVVESISHESIRIISQEHDLKPWLQKYWCVPKLNEEFVERMEDVLDIYALPLDEKRPVVCIDEKNTQLLDEVKPQSGIAPGKEKKVDYEYKRNGSCNIFCAVQPLVGKYINEVTEKRTSNDFAKFLHLIEQKYKDAEKIIVVMDNLNTHKMKSLTDFYGEKEGTRIWNRLEVHYTPKHGSWLNQAEISINMYTRQCLGKSRIPEIEALKKKN
jgi:transposase